MKALLPVLGFVLLVGITFAIGLSSGSFTVPRWSWLRERPWRRR